MQKIVLLSCVSKKLSHEAKASELYTSPLFKYNLKYALSFQPDKIFVLSAKYGLVKLDDIIQPYELTLNKMKSEEIQFWANQVLTSLRKEADFNFDQVIFLAGLKYRKYLTPHIKNYTVPLQGLGIGRQLKFLKNKVLDGTQDPQILMSQGENTMSKACRELHTIFNNLLRFNFPFDKKTIPSNGIYILFEKGERAHGKDRIVRVGTHTGKDQLQSRLLQHFVNENKDRSIFRKNIGRAILNKNKDPFLEYWEIDLTTRKAKEKYDSKIDFKKQKEIEKIVTKYLQENFSFAVFQADDKNKRLELESKIISTISACKECKGSTSWLGNFSPKEKIRNSGLWLVNELNKQPLNEKEIKELRDLISPKIIK